MTKLEELKADLKTAVESHKNLVACTGKSYKMLIRNGLAPGGLIASYVRIIKSLKDEIAQLEAKAALKKSKKATKKVK